MSSISDDEADSIAPESSISQQAKTSSVTTQSLPIPDPTSIGEYFIVKDTPEYPILSLMVRDTLAVPAMGAGVERQFSRSGRVVTPLRHCLQPDSVHEIMMYKNHLSRKYQKELVLFEDAGAMVVEEGKLETEVEPPHLREWKDQWWKERKRRNRL